MKTTTKITRHALWLAIAAFLMMGASQAFADHYGNPYHSHDGFWDSHRHYHSYGVYHHHDGYWDQRNGVHIWINI